MIAMRDVTERLGKVRASDHPQAFAVIGEAVWWVTIVDATVVRYYPDAYEQALGRAQVRQEPDGLLLRPRRLHQPEAQRRGRR
jgi:hypothetical protein